MPTVHLRIRGRVQGVFYRATARDVAEKEGLKGWVRNTEEGDVEAVVTGTEAQVAAFTSWCRRGPSEAIVTEVTVTPMEATPFDHFKVIR